MERFKSLDPPHKGLRHALGQLTLLTGKTKFSDHQQVEKLKKLAEEVFFLLKDHTKTENEFILKPLEEKNALAAEPYFEDHTDIEEWENHLFESIKNLDGTQTDDQGHLIYLNLCDFQSAYLDHIDEEDVELEEKLQKHFSDEELIQHQIKIMQQMEFSTLLLWFKYIVPARRTEENAQVLRNFKSNAPDEAFHAVIQTIQGELSHEEFEAIIKAI
ncbi:MAG: hypothetical protein RLY64_465 [Bacteroidota bacterium]|jgi:hypothetical protein